MGKPVLEVIEPGLLTTVQDLGRPDAVHLGVPGGGACDPRSLSTANALLGNAPGDAALEVTLAGPTLRILADCTLAFAGADFEAWISPPRRAFPAGTTRQVQAGDTVSFGTPREGSGIRGYLAVPGGVDVPVVLGSRSTCLAGNFGGMDGRALRAGDVVAAAAAGPLDPAVEHNVPAGPPLSRAIRVVSGPHEYDALQPILDARWTVSARSDRQGVRLEGPRLHVAGDGEMLSHGVTWGALQVPPDGQPICLLADHQTVGGYPVVAVVAIVDRPALGQLGPGDEVSFELIDVALAQRLARTESVVP